MSRRLASRRLASYRTLLALLLVAGGPSLSPAAAAGDACGFAETVALNAIHPRDREPSAGIDLLQLTIPADGVLTLHASTPATDLAQPRLVFLGDDCTGGGYTVIRQTPAGLVLWVAQGSHFVEVSAEDPEQPLSFYKLQTAFVAEIEWWTKDVDPIDDDDVPGGGFANPWMKDVDPIDDDDVPGGGFTRPVVALCRLGEADDHSDMPLCATPLTADAGFGGTLDSAIDDDYFAFELAAQETVTIAVSTDDAAALVLLDERGQRLESRSCSDACVLRVVRTLGAGRFDLRVAGGGAVRVRYEAKVAVLDRW